MFSLFLLVFQNIIQFSKTLTKWGLDCLLSNQNEKLSECTMSNNCSLKESQQILLHKAAGSLKYYSWLYGRKYIHAVLLLHLIFFEKEQLRVAYGKIISHSSSKIILSFPVNDSFRSSVNNII